MDWRKAMLRPSSDRLNYGNLLIPPPEFRADFALGTTYSLDLEALVGLPLALFLSEEMSKSLLNNPIVALEGLRRSSERFAVLCEGGQIKVPQNQNAVFSLLEDSVFEVVLPNNWSFHPKIWLIRYQDERKQPLYRLLVLSRNLTFDRSWDMAVCMEGRLAEEAEDEAAAKQNMPLMAFLEYLRVRVKNRKKRDQISKMLEELKQVRFETNDPHYSDFSFHPLGIPGHTKKPDELFDTYKDLLIISPFLSKGMIERFKKLALSNSTCTLITRRTEIAKLSQELLEAFDVYAMKEMVVEGEEGLSGDDLNDEAYQNQDIHAKFYARSKYSQHSFFVGSANCSESAFSGNVEFMLQLRYRKHGFRIQHLLDDLFSKDEKDNPFEQIKELPEVDAPDTATADLLEKAIKQLCRTRSKASVTKEGQQYRVKIEFAKIPEEVDLTIASMTGIQPVKLEPVTILPLLLLEQLSEFYQVTARKEETTVRRIIKIKTTGIPEERDKAVFRSIIRDEDIFMKYVAFLLSDNLLLSSLEQMDAERLVNGTSNVSWLQAPVLYENMLKTVARDPERLKEIERVIKLIDDQEIIPEDFNELYQIFSQAAKKVKR
jgi:hypothetical protein